MPYADQNGNKVYLIIQLDFGSKKVANSDMQMSRYGFMSHWNLNFIKVFQIKKCWMAEQMALLVKYHYTSLRT